MKKIRIKIKIKIKKIMKKNKIDIFYLKYKLYIDKIQKLNTY